MIQKNQCRIRFNSNGILLWTGDKFVPCTADEASKVLRNVTAGYPKQAS